MHLHGRASNATTAGAAALLSAGAGALVARNPFTGLAVFLLVPLVALLVAKPGARLAAVILGALTVFQSTASAGKFAYLGLAVLCCVLSGVRLGRTRDPIIDCFRPLIFGGTAFASMLLISSFVARGSGVSTADWLRDITPYVLLLVLPIVGIDAGRGLTRRQIDIAMAALGIFTALGFALDWLNRRGVSSLGVGRLILATIVLPALAFCYAIARADRGWRAPAWIAIGGVIAGLLLITGTRTNFLLIFGLLGALGRRSRAGISIIRLLLYTAGIAVALVFLLPILAKHVISDPAFLSGRMQAAIRAVGQGGGSDLSYQAREHAYELSKAQFYKSPWLGQGPGSTYAGATLASDTPWNVPEKFGILGTLILISYLTAIAWSIRSLLKLSGPLMIGTAARSWVIFLAVLLPFGPWTEDKGMPLALTLLVASAVAWVKSATPSPPQPGVEVIPTPQAEHVPLRVELRSSELSEAGVSAG